MPWTPTVSRCPHSITSVPLVRPSSSPTTLGLPGRTGVTTTSSPAAAIAARAISAAAASPGAPGISDGLTEFAATRSLRRGNGSIEENLRLKTQNSKLNLNDYDRSVAPLSHVIAITGASSGIGRACAIQLAREGAAVVVSARRIGRLDALVQTIVDDGGRAIAVAADVTIEDDLQRIVDRAVEMYGRLDVMICNAGIGFHDAFVDTPTPIIRRLV